MNQLPWYIPTVFILTTFITIFLFYRATEKRKNLLIIMIAWLFIQSLVALTGFFTITNVLPPRLLVLLFVPGVSIAVIFLTDKGRAFTDAFNPQKLALLHIIRIPIELVLFSLFLYKTIPQLMTFEGRNFDLFSGITAPLVYYFGFVKKRLGMKTVLVWNFICLFILLFTVANAILSAPTPFQQFSFDQPTVAVLYFPYIWLPGLVVPIVIFAHLSTIRILWKQTKRAGTIRPFIGTQPSPSKLFPAHDPS